MSNLVVKRLLCEAKGSLDNALRDALRLAKRHSVEVAFAFNGRQVVIAASTDLAKIKQMLHASWKGETVGP